MRNLFDFLRNPLLDSMDVDGESRLELHRKMLEKKRMLREVFTEFHHLFKMFDGRFLSGKGIEVELGTGVSPMRDSYTKVLAMDIVEASYLDRVINEEAIDFEYKSARTTYGQNCFHHFPHPDQFFSELDRVLVPEGDGAILIEPYYGPFATILFKRMFRTESFEKNYPFWETPAAGPMNGVNQALSYIVFIRDRAQFELKHPSLKIAHQQLAGNYLKYLLSGGLNFRQLLPDSFTGVVGLLEKLISPLNRWIELRHISVVRKVVL